ncbi:type IV secretion protein Rhs [Dictyobacter alpinus]|uniref:Type IV secretion protein Rhs n=1 Tax=Dictyobacter alpinus TaxID=2014873 RepID=A0A402B3S1_9CHLR|nr:RHS repeat-associated core domain-containing protein [Dictyobacter alpinus]GCE25991.1 type IV secretion protein Rhs [Dictyobacter alpinus]
MNVVPTRQVTRSSWHSLWRLLLVISLTTGAILTTVMGATPSAYAATAAATATPTTDLPPTFSGVRTPRRNVPVPTNVHDTSSHVSPFKPAQTKTVQGKTVQAKAAVIVNGTTPLNGLGDSSLYTFIDKPLSDRLDLKVNVANGNLVLHTVELQVTGTGLNNTVGGYYNSQNNWWLTDHGTNWGFTTGRGASLYLDDVPSGGGIKLTLPTGLKAYFAPDGSGGYKDAPSLKATLVHPDSATYELRFHQSGERWIFNQWGTRYEVLDKNNNLIDYHYLDNGDWTGTTDTQGRTISTTLDANHLVKAVTDNTLVGGKTRTITYGYDAQLNLTSITDANNKQTIFTYDPDGDSELMSIKDPQGRTTTITYGATGQVSTITDAYNKQTTFTYNSGNTVVKDVNGHSTTYTYQDKLQVTKTTNALGKSTNSSFDANSYNVTSYADALTTQTPTNYQYATNGETSQITDPTGATTKFTYSPLSGGQQQNVPYQPTTGTDAQNNVTTNAYDNYGNLTSSSDTTGGKTNGSKLQYSYNADGTPSGSKDANGNTTLYGYDGKGNLSTVTPPAPMGKTTLTYDALSRVSTETDGVGNKTSFTYDVFDRILTITYGTGTANATTVTYTYDNDGNDLTEKDGTGTTTFTYDNLNRQTNKLLPGGTNIVSTFDNIGNLTSLNDGTGLTKYGYNEINLVTTLTDPGNAITTYGYDDANRKTRIQYPNGTGMIIGYDAAGRQVNNVGGKTTGSGSTLAIPSPYTGYTYNYGSSTASKEVLQSAVKHSANNYSVYGTWTYQYDSLNRLSDVKNPTQHWAIGYDTNGNMTSKQYTGASNFIATYTNFNAANQPTGASSTGNYAGKPVSASATYSYDANGNLTAITNSGDSKGALSLAQTHTYNNANQDVSGAGSTKTYTQSYSGTDQTQRVNNNGTSTIYTGLGLSTEKVAGNTTEYVRCSCGMLNSERTSAGKVYYYLFDGLGSIVGMTDSAGNMAASYDYDPFGGVAGSVIQPGVNNPWQYAGGYYDSTTDLIKFGIRYYDVRFNRWTQRTPVGGSLQETLKANPYTYADDNPVNEVDPSGAVADWNKCIGKVSLTGIWGLLGIYGSSKTDVFPRLNNLVKAILPASLDAAKASAGTTLLAALKTFGGVIGWGIALVSIGYALYSSWDDISQACK